MNIKSYSGVVAGVVASTTVLVTPAQAANVQVRELEVRPGDGKLELALSLAPESANLSGEKPQVSTTQKDRVLIAEIANARLDLGNGQDIFTQDNPLPGIERIEVMESAPGNVKIVALGEVTAPKGEILSQDDNSILLNVTTPTTDVTEIAQAAEPSTPSTVIEPTLLAQSNPSNGDQNNFLQPTAPIPPFLPRASAPPVGDISISTIDTTFPALVDLRTNAVIPRLVLKEAPVQDVLSLLARSANYNVVFSEPPAKTGAADSENKVSIADRTISIDLENERVQEAFNYVLMLSDLTATLRGKTIFIGDRLPVAVAPRITRTFRLNQARPEEVRCFLLTGDATVSESTTVTTSVASTGASVDGGESDAGAQSESAFQETRVTNTSTTRNCLGGATVPESPVRGERPVIDNGVINLFSELEILTDSRLNAITLSGEPKTIDIASNFITQLDARKRQVAVNVKILDVTLSGNRSISSDIKLLLEDRVGISAGDGIILSPNDLSRTSNLFSEFNQDSINIETGNTNRSLGTVLDVGDGGTNAFFVGRATDVFDRFSFDDFISVNDGIPIDELFSPDEIVGVFREEITRVINEGTENEATITDVIFVPRSIGTQTTSPTRGTNFIGSLVAGLLRNTTSKIISDPTLIIQEGETATVDLTEKILVGTQIVEVVNANGDVVGTAREPVLDDVGLQVQVNIEGVDDNGFVTLNVSPVISSVAGFDEVEGETVTLKRSSSLQSGRIRLRDDQTLLLAGVIDERDLTTTEKVPILGDIPIIGSLFRSTSRDNSRRELLFIVTPQVIDDSMGAGWGYGYQPSETAREMLENSRFPTR